MNFISKTLGFLSALLIGFPMLGNVPLADVQFVSTKLILPSIDGKQYTAERFSGVDLGNDSFSWIGKIKGARGGFVSLAVVNGESTVTVSFADGITYSFRGKLENLVLKPLVSSHQVCGGCVAVADGKLPADPRMGAQPMLSWQNGDANLIDLLVVYPALVRSDAGGTSAIQAEIVKAVVDSNLCYRNSQVNVQLRLVHMEEVSYTPTGLLETDLSRLKATNDGYIDNVHTLRDSYGADLVALLTTASNSGGLASTLMHPSLDFESSGFSVNVWTQISAPSYTLAHEIGHNMGCLHNVEDSSGVTSQYDYAAFCYGKRWLYTGQGYKTVMSYDTNPSSTYPITIPYFSNPDIEYQGMATGNQGSADNAQVLSSTAPYVSNFRASVVQGILPNLFDSEVGEGNYSNILIRLSAKPSSPVTVAISISGDTDLILTSASTLSFNSSNWNLPHTIQVYAKPDTDGSSDTGTLLLTAPGIPSVSVSLVEVDNGSNTSTGFLLTGVVTNELGIGLGGVSLSLSNGGGLTTSDLDGSFLINLPLNWSGLVTPSRAGYSFSPSNLSLGAVVADTVGHLIVASRSDVLFVDTDAVGAGDGTSWANAYTDLGDALRATTLFTEVWVATGTYKAGMVRSSTFLIPPNIAVYGGFSGNEVSRNSRDVEANQVILSGDFGILNNNTDNAFHVVVPSQGSVLDGFTITRGNASENFSNDDRGKGAGLWADSASITVSNCKFISNNAYQGGAAIYLKDVNGTFSNCEIISNTTNSTGSGAGLYLEDSNVSFTSSIFSDNQAHFHAGAIRSENSEINLLNCSLSSNRSLTSNGGGAMYLNGGIFSIKTTSFTNNQATFQGGAILISGASGSMEDSNFTGNQNTNSNGGGALLIENSSPSILRCRFIENSTSANNHGGAIKLDTSSASITDSIFIGNRSLTNSAGAIYFDSSSSPSFSNNEFRLNSAAQFGGAFFVNGSNLNLTGDLFLGNYANLGGGIATQGTMSVSLSNVRALGNEANSSSSSSAGFIYLNSGVTSSTFMNSIFSGNKSLGRYGVYRPNGPSRFVNCSIVGNEAGTDGGVTLMFTGDSIELDNSIVWGNIAGTGNNIWVNAGTATANYSLFNPSESIGTISGSNNLNSDPLFADSDGADNMVGSLDDDLTLQAGSPAVDQASSSVANYPTADLLGRARAGAPDMGAYELTNNSAPTFLTASNFSIFENQTVVSDINATDLEGDVLIYSISGGADQNKFSINSVSGLLSFITPPDFENPMDNSGINSYQVQVFVSDGFDISSQMIQVTVQDVFEPSPVENFVLNLSASTGGTVTGGGTFESGTSVILNAIPEAGYSFDHWSGDANGSDNPLTLMVDSNLTIIAQFVLLESNSSNDFDFNSTELQIAENSPVGTEVGYLYQTEGDFNVTINYSLVFDNAPSALPFELNSTGSILNTADLDFEQNASYWIEVRAITGDNQTVTRVFMISVLDVNEESGGGGNIDSNESGYGVGPEFTLDTRDPELPGGGGGNVDLNESGYGGGPEFTLDTRDPELPGGGGDSVDLNESGYGVGPEFTLDTRDPELPGGGGGNVDLNESGYGVGPEFTLDTRDPELPGGGGGNVDLNESGIGVGPEFTLDTRDPELPGGGGGNVDSNESGYGVGPEFTLDTRDPELPGGGGGNVDLNESGIGVGPEFTLDTRDPELPGGGGGNVDLNESGYGVGPEFTLDTRDPELPGGGGGNVDLNESGYGVGPEFTLDTRDPELPGGGGGNVDLNESGYGMGPEFTLDTRDPKLPGGGGGNIDSNESGYGVGPEFTLDTRDPELPGGGGGSVDLNESGYGVGPEFTLDTRDPELPGGGGGNVDLNESGYGVGPEFTLDTRDPELPGGGGGNVDLNESGYGVGPEFTLDTRDPELPGGGGGNVDLNESGYGVGPEFTLDTRDPELPGGGGGNIDSNESGYGVGPEFTLDTRDPELPGGGGGNVDLNESGYGVGPEFTLDTRDPELPGGGGGNVDLNESGYGVGPEFTLDTRDPELPGGGGGNVDLNESGYGVGPEFTLDTRDPEVPPFDFNATSLMISEDASIDSFVGNFYQTSGDRNVSVTYQIEGASNQLPFAIVGGGDLISMAFLDYESISQYPLTVKAETSKGEVVVHDFVIKVIDVYEAPFDFNASALMISEDAPIDSLVGNFYQTSGDRNVSVTYQIEGGSNQLPFAIVGGGDLISRALLDYELISQYPITVKAETSKGEVVIHDFVIEVMDVYEAPFDFNATSLMISEDASIDSFVGNFYQTSGDRNVSVTYQIEGASNQLPFAIVGGGDLISMAFLDYGSISQYPITVKAETSKGEVVIHDFVIEVMDVYEAPFDFNATALIISEDGPIDSFVGNFYQISGDRNVSVTYQIEGGSNQLPFAIVGGVDLISTGLLDYESINQYSITVKAETSKGEVVVHDFVIEVMDVYEAPFDFNATSLMISEDALLDSLVGNFYQTSGDRNVSVTYQIEGGSNQLPFAIVGGVDLISTGLLDYESINQYSITVKAETSKGEVVVHDFVIEVMDVYEAPFDFNATSLMISEDAPLDSLVGNFYQTSGDRNVSVTYQIEGGSNQLPFAIVGGVDLISTGLLDYESINQYSITVKAETSKGEVVVHNFVISVVDVYEYVAGPFDFNSTELKIAEDAKIGSFIGQMVQSSGEADTAIQYSLTSLSSDPFLPFIIDDNGSLITTATLDYEGQAKYSIEVSAWTSKNENEIHTFIVEVLDIYESPFDFNATALKIAENAPVGSAIGQFYQSSGGTGKEVSYHLVQNNDLLSSLFDVDENGTLLTTGSLDYEQDSSYEIEVSAWTVGNENKTHMFTVEVLDVYEAPFDFNVSSSRIAEDSSIGSEVGQFIQVSGDENETVSYYLLHDSNSSVVPFKLEGNGSLVTTAPLDYEKDSSYKIEVSAWTEDNKNITHTFTIQVLDIYEAPFDFNVSSSRIAEDSSIGSEVGQFIQVSGDENETVSYHLVHDLNSSPVPFMLNENGSLVTTAPLDYEKDSSYEIEVSAWTEDNKNITHTFIIQVLDIYEELFDFNATALKIIEDAPVGSEVGQFVQVSGGENERVSYHILHDLNSSPVPFMLDENGTLVTTAALDFEKDSNFSIEVSAWTEGNENVTRTFVVEILDIYDPPFDFNSSILRIAENAPIGSEVGQFMQISGDPNGTVEYNLIPEMNSSLPFSLSANGVLVTSASLDFEMYPHYSISVSATTETNETKRREFIVVVSDVYEYVSGPFDFNATTLEINENKPLGSFVGQFFQTSGDQNISVEYRLEFNSSTEGSPLMVDVNGTLFTTMELDFEQNSQIPIRVGAFINGTEGIVRNFMVDIIDVFEEEFDFNSTILEVAENMPIGSFVGEMVKTAGTDFAISYHLINPAGQLPPPFMIESNGSLVSTQLLDFESIASYPILIRAITENGDRVNHDFVVTVTDVFEEPFDFNATALIISEDAVIGSLVGSVSQISGEPETSVMYTMLQTAGQLPPPFMLESNGSLVSTQLLDFESVASYPISIRTITESGDRVTHDFVVEVLDVYEEPFDFNATALLISEDAVIGSLVGSVSQISGEPETSVMYTMLQTAGQLPPPFMLESNGSLVSTQLLDFESIARYPISIRAITENGDRVTHDFVVEVLDVYEEPFDFNATALLISEDAVIGSLVGSVSQSSGKPESSVLYAMLQTAGQLPPPFILEGTGDLVTTQLLDFESTASYPVTIRAVTESGDMVTHDFVVTVTDVFEEPFDFIATELIVSEHAPIGSLVGSVSQISGEPETSVMYTMLQTTGQLPSPFMIESNGSLVSTQLLDFESIASYPVTIRAVTESGDIVIHNFVVEVLDVYEEPFDFNTTELVISEDAPIGSVVGLVSQISGDESESVFYTLDYPITENSPPFMLASDGNLVTIELLDFESQENYPISIRGITASGEVVTHDFVVKVLDVYEAPFDFNATELVISEDAPIGSVVGSVYQTSGDMNISVVYDFEYPFTQEPPPFMLESNGSLVNTGVLDYETMPSYVLSIRGITTAGETAIYEFTIEVLDVDELPHNNPPSDIEVLPNPLSVKGNKDAGTEVGTFSAVDLDELDEHVFVLANGSGARDNSLFEINENGVLRTKEVLDLGSDKTLIIRVQATDSRGGVFAKAIMIDYIHEEPGEDAVLLSEGAEIIPGWKRAGWFGFYFADFYPWVYHENLGWLFVSEKSTEGAWFHRERLGWVWTSPEVFPNLYQAEKDTWVYLDISYPFTVLFDYERMEWFILDLDFYITGSSNPAKGGYIKGLGNYQRGDFATIEAVPESGYLFVEWRGGLNGTNPVQQFEIHEDFQVEAIFEPIISPNASPAEKINNAVKAIQSMDHLSTEEKQQSLIELLLFGKSSTAGISASN